MLSELDPGRVAAVDPDGVDVESELPELDPAAVEAVLDPTRKK